MALTIETRRAPVLDGARVERIARALAIALLLAFTVTLLAGSGSSTASGRVGGDYPAFYGAGRIVLDGDGHHLYDPARQDEAERGLFGHEQQGFLYFAYPPAVAATYAPFAALPYRLSYALHTLLMVGALVLALWLLRPIAPILEQRFWTAVVLALAFFPMFRAISGGQNTALTVLLVACAWRAAHDDRLVLCGAAVGLLLFKPQLAVLFLVLLAITGRWRAIVGAAITGGALYLASVPVAGWAWVGTWLSRAQWFSGVDARVNGKNAVSLMGAAEAAFGAQARWAIALAALAAGVVVLVTVRVWRVAGRDDLAGPFGVACAAAVLAVPHVMFYDAGLLVLTGVAVLATDDRRARAVLAVLGGAGVAHVLTGVVPVNPLFVVAVAVFLVAVVTADAAAARPRHLRSSYHPADDGRPRLSIVVPAYNERARIEPTMSALAAYAARQPGGVEVVIVDDGSSDGTADAVRELGRDIDGLRVLEHERNQGKGAAVRTGMQAATGRWRVFLDADLSTPVDDVDRLLEAARRTDVDVAVGSVAVAGAEVGSRQSVVRTALGTLASFLVRLTVVPGVKDTQRGIKLFSARAADEVFSLVASDGWVFDVEALAVARRRGYDITEVGVRWSHRDGGTLRGRAYVETLLELGRIARRTRRIERVTPTSDVAAAAIPGAAPPLAALAPHRRPAPSRSLGRPVSGD